MRRIHSQCTATTQHYVKACLKYKGKDSLVILMQRKLVPIPQESRSGRLSLKICQKVDLLRHLLAYQDSAKYRHPKSRYLSSSLHTKISSTACVDKFEKLSPSFRMGDLCLECAAGRASLRFSPYCFTVVKQSHLICPWFCPGPLTKRWILE